LDQDVEDFPLGVDRSPKIDHAAANPQINFVKVPGGMRLYRALELTT